jgi:hypothetical protein
MVSGALEASDRNTLVQRLLRYYAELSSDTASDRDIVSEHMGHLCVPSILYSFITYAGVSVVSVHVIRLRQLFRTFAGNSVAVLTLPGSFRLSWMRSFLTPRPFPTSPSFKTFLI